MLSRLFHTIVGVGISLAASACGGAIESAAPNERDASTPPTDAAVAFDAGVDASLDVSVKDAARDVIEHAFCDAAWPTTKGQPRRPACTNPKNECATTTQGPDVGDGSVTTGWCFDLLGPNHCGGRPQWDHCVSGQWVCAPGSIGQAGCRCYGAAPLGYVCTPEGFRPIDAGKP
jgi:hypothetical protein